MREGGAAQHVPQDHVPARVGRCQHERRALAVVQRADCPARKFDAGHSEPVTAERLDQLRRRRGLHDAHQQLTPVRHQPLAPVQRVAVLGRRMPRRNGRHRRAPEIGRCGSENGPGAGSGAGGCSTGAYTLTERAVKEERGPPRR
eukprot:scaffold16934_cov91-Isochrysis_galbana.AAC.2